MVLLLPEAKTEWIRLSEKLNQMGVLTEIDRSAFAAYCQSYARWKEAQEHINSEGAAYETENGKQTPPIKFLWHRERRTFLINRPRSGRRFWRVCQPLILKFFENLGGFEK